MSFVVYGIAAVIFFLTTFLNTRERVSPPKAQKTSVLRDLGDLVTNGPWIIVLATTITFILSGAIRSSATAHYFKYYVGSQTLTLPSFLPKSAAGTQTWGWESLVSAFNTSNQLASLVGVILIPFFTRIAGRKALAIVLFIVTTLSAASFLFLGPGQIALIFGLNLFLSVTSGPLVAILWAMCADTADYAEWKRGRRATGLIFSASIFSQKQGWALGAWVALALMQSVGFVANTVQTPRSLHGLVLLMSVIPAALSTLALVLVLFYPLTEARLSKIASDLRERRALDAAESPAATPQGS